MFKRTEKYTLNNEYRVSGIIAIIGAIIMSIGLAALCLHVSPDPLLIPIIVILVFSILLLVYISYVFLGKCKSILIDYMNQTIKVDRVYHINEISHLVYFKSSEKYVVLDALQYLKTQSGDIYNFGIVLKNSDKESDISTIHLADVVLLDKGNDIGKMYRRILRISKFFNLQFVDFINTCVYENGTLKEILEEEAVLPKSIEKRIKNVDTFSKKQKKYKKNIYVQKSPLSIELHYFLAPLSKSNLFMILILLLIGGSLIFFSDEESMAFALMSLIPILLVCFFFTYLHIFSTRGTGWISVKIAGRFLYFRNHRGHKRKIDINNIDNIINLSPNSYNLLLISKDLNTEYLGCRSDSVIQRILCSEVKKYV